MKRDKNVQRVGEVWKDHIGSFRVMASQANWHMCRRPDCKPFTVSEGEFRNGRALIGAKPGGNAIAKISTDGEL